MQTGDIHLPMLPLGILGVVKDIRVDTDPPGGGYPKRLCESGKGWDKRVAASPGG